MNSLQLTLLYCVLHFFAADNALEYKPSSPVKVVKACANSQGTTNMVEPEAINVILQSTDGGATWQDISRGLPADERPGGFFAGASELYIRFKDKIYRSKNHVKTPVWAKDTTLDSRTVAIAFNPAGVIAYNYDGEIIQKMPAGTWVPMYTTFKIQRQTVRKVFETSDGTVFLDSDNGLYKSADKGLSWKRVSDGVVIDLVQSQGVLVATSQNGIMRSSDNGEHWQSVINEGGVGIDVEVIDGGFAAVSYSNSTMSRRVRVSMDSGKTWQAIDEGLRPSLSITSIKQMGKYLICGHPDGIYRSSDMGKTWVNVYPSKFKIIDGEAFIIHAAGNVLYAVAGGGGC
jgi:photosystem II stability/assembly factor-like uncharacterized protein